MVDLSNPYVADAYGVRQSWRHRKNPDRVAAELENSQQAKQCQQQQALEKPATIRLGRNRKKITGRPVDQKDRELRDRSLAPYTVAGKRTKSKIKWGTKTAETGTSTTLAKHPYANDLAYQSRGYGAQRRYRFRVSGNALICVDTIDTIKPSLVVGRFVERLDDDGAVEVFEWEIDPARYQMQYQRACEFLSVEPVGGKNPPAIRIAIAQFRETSTLVDREIARKSAKKAKRNRKRPPSRVRKAQQQKTVHKLY